MKWMIEGAVVGLCANGRLVATGKVECLNPDATVHNRTLGPDRVKVLLIEVLDSDMDWTDDEKLEEMVGSYLVWDKAQLQESTVIQVGSSGSKSQLSHLAQTGEDSQFRGGIIGEA